MPITPLHFGLLAVTNRWLKGHISVFSFILVNLWIDAPLIWAWLNEQPLPSHDHGNHTLIGAAILAVIVAMVGVRSMSWVVGAFFGALSHILLDALVHPEMQPLMLMMEGNPFYMGWMMSVSLILTPLTAWFIAQSVSGSLDYVRTLLGRLREPTQETDALALEPAQKDFQSSEPEQLR